MMCRMFDDTKKRCQEAQCENCKDKSWTRENLYESLSDIDLSLGIDH